MVKEYDSGDGQRFVLIARSPEQFITMSRAELIPLVKQYYESLKAQRSSQQYSESKLKEIREAEERIDASLANLQS
jgi:hypothetical protein